MKKVLTEAQQTIEKHKMLKGVRKLIVAFSSGPDSVCLLDALNTLYGDKIDIHLVYVNHGLRPNRILKAEENLTKIYALKYHLKYKIIKVKINKTKIGIEAAARAARHNVLLNYLKQISGQRIALGHNLDDVLETFLMNLLRGSGTRGLKSIPAVRRLFIRPLINLKKEEILRFLKNRKLPYTVDKTNIKLKFRRNLLRHKIIPQLIRINPELHETIKRGIEILKQDDEYLEEQATKAYKNVARKEKNDITLDLKMILRYNPSIISRIVMKVIKDLRGDLAGYESKHVDGIIGLKDKVSGKKINLPKGLYAQREYNTVVIGTAKPVQTIELAVKPEGSALILGNLRFRTRVVSSFDLKKLKSNCEVFDLAKIKRPLLIRNRRLGDYIDTKIGKKKLKKVFNELKIPLRRRSETMMLCDQKSILWILGRVRAFRGFIDKKTKKILVGEFEYID